VGWLLLALGLSAAWGGVPPAYAAYGLVARPGALPAAQAVARSWPITIVTTQTAASFALLLTPTVGDLPLAREVELAVSSRRIDQCRKAAARLLHMESLDSGRAWILYPVGGRDEESAGAHPTGR
jgi:hypothetical protein